MEIIDNKVLVTFFNGNQAINKNVKAIDGKILVKQDVSIEVIIEVLRYLDKLNQELDKNGSNSIPFDILNHSTEIMEFTESLWIFGKAAKIKSLENRLEFAKLHNDDEAVKSVTAELKTFE